MKVNINKRLRLLIHTFTKTDKILFDNFLFLYKSDLYKKYIHKHDKDVLIEHGLKGETVYCPICSHSYNTFLSFGLKRRFNALCPNCSSLERHRLIWLFLKENNLLDGKGKFLHVAPENAFFHKFRKIWNDNYFPVDKFEEGYNYPEPTQNADITKLDFQDNYFDFIMCNHVLEHITDEESAIKELKRVLKPGGKAILQVPLDYTLEKTFEDNAITDPKQREINFGQHDHVRLYGLDYKKRLENYGFVVEENKLNDNFQDDEKKYYGLPDKEYIYLCHKGN